MIPTNNYFFDASVLIDYFGKDEESTSQITNLRTWVEDTLADELSEIYTNTVVMLEFAKFLFYQEVALKKIKSRIRNISNYYNIKVIGYGTPEMWESIDKFANLPIEIECHAGELSLLPFTKNFNAVYVSSDENSLKSFKMVDRVNPRKSAYVTQKGNEYQN